ncbi:MAG: 16S rRNA (adenine(1518)-N(6)/adenine(1519)-N(6))-dimethyltransferase RsmA [Gammaproteobacteria bacterium]|nr:16S rRNA (adenine(1518)-N(6)/adenine(1519)-N(6))-dimethyltransferase RsmA [Gammaproteobacteria bacterium]
MPSRDAPAPGTGGANHRPRKRFGQNFLRDGTVIERIVAAIDPRHGQRLVEIGPGEGALTAPLLAAAGRLAAIELDRDLVARLRDRFPPDSGLELIEGDALAFDFRALAGEGPLRLVGNLPYNISTPLLFHLFAQRDAVADMHFMLQREVVDRLAASPGTKSYGRLSVMAQYACEIRPVLQVPPRAFRPPPKVDSTVVRLVPHATPPVTVDDPERLRRLVSAAFAQRRKTLRNSLRDQLDAEAMIHAGIDPGRRAETLSLAEFAALANLR